jgi:uncharacterized repeat protein (TIGR02543 family)
VSITDINLSKNNIGNAGATKLITALPDLKKLALADNRINDAGADALAKLTKLQTLDLSGNRIGDEGAVALSALEGVSKIAIDLRNNNIGITGMKELISAGFAELKLDGQIITASAITDGRLPIEHHSLSDALYIVPGSVSGEGVLDASSGVITWPERMSDTIFSYQYSYGGFTGTVYIPFIYEPFIYTVTFDDRNGNKNSIQVEDNTPLAMPESPVKEGYIFVGWSQDKKSNDVFDFDTPITDNITLYANWDQNVEDDDSLQDEDNKDNGTPDSGASAGSHSPDTGDNTSALLQTMILLLASATGVIICITFRRRKGSR